MSQPSSTALDQRGEVVDLLLRAGAVHPMTADGVMLRAVAVSRDRIVATSSDAGGLDHLVVDGTRILDAPDLTVLPAFNDAHEHLLEAAQATALVPLSGVQSLNELIDLIRGAAATAAPGAWVQTSSSWHESDLAERRLPTIDELDAASPSRPVYVRRGGHLAVANSETLRLAGITDATPDPPGGAFGRDEGRLNGVIEGSAVYSVLSHAPALPVDTLVEGLRVASAAYAALGVGSIREALIQPEEWAAYAAAAAQGVLNVRARPLIRIPDGRPADDGIAFLDDLDALDRVDTDMLRLWGLKVVFDGGVEGAALDEPYANNPASKGHVNWDVDTMIAVGTTAVRRGWRIGTHAVGDRAISLVLDVYEQIQRAVPDLAARSLVIEHALLADHTLIERAVSLRIPVTVQHALLWNMGSEMVEAWGPERTARVNPVDGWLRAGAEIAVGTDLNRPFNPLTSVWGMVTRGTKTAGVQGFEHAIDRYTAIERYTAGTARLCGESDRLGTIEAGRLADLVAYPRDPFLVDVDALPSLEPAFTMVGGHIVHDPQGRLDS